LSVYYIAGSATANLYKVSHMKFSSMWPEHVLLLHILSIDNPLVFLLILEIFFVFISV